MVPALRPLEVPNQFMAHCLLLLAGITMAMMDWFQCSKRDYVIQKESRLDLLRLYY